MLLENLKSLREDMEKKDWTICNFIFNYKKIEYIVLVKRFVGVESKANKYASVKLHFIRSDNLEYELICEANSRQLLIDPKTLREFFGITYGKNLGDILKQFTSYLGKSIPNKITIPVSELAKKVMVQSLSISDSEDPNKIYCTNVKRNSSGKRSKFNSDKTKILRNELFKYFMQDKSISFCYSSDAEKENDDITILKNFAINNSEK
ncbi:MAG: DUF6037 family protein [Treponema sp.]|uniref:DUF6037 family protein n=1 Tax=Treponema sp. TaxID=166 RepID=UPI003FA1EFBC